MAQKSAALTPFRDLTGQDLETFAGSQAVERGRSYQKGGQVQQLARTPEGGIVAWVQGGERYATRVEWQEGRLVSACTCPIGRACKHAVAVALECLDRLERSRPIPLADSKDSRLQMLNAAAPHEEEKDGKSEEPGAAGRPQVRRPRRRDRDIGGVIAALEKAGRLEEALRWCEREVEAAGGYPRLVERLAIAGRQEDAEQWLRLGIAATREKQPAIAEELRSTWCRWREAAGDWPQVAALHAESFFAQPSLASFQALQRAAEHSGAGPTVRAAALRFLETGKLPGRPSWRLPATGLPAPRSFSPPFPDFETLIELAIAEQRPGEVLRWYDRQRQEGAPPWDAGPKRAQVADAVAATHPERALEIWMDLVEAEIARTGPDAYEAAAVSLQKVEQLLTDLGREQEWQVYEAALRQAHRRKWRFIEILDAVGRSGRPILSKV